MFCTLNNTLLYNIKRYIAQHHLLEVGGKYIVALSGGADSVCLLLSMKELGYRIEAAHCNFHLRGEESERDELFCEKLCLQEEIPFHRAHFDTREYASLHHVGIEMAARELRYSYFEQLRKDLNADGICVAHHQEDSVETFFINLLRGTGLHGLTGISPKNGHVIRPLLCVKRDDIEQYLKDKNQPYVTDSTNLKADVIRNQVRLQLIPVLKDIHPSAQDNILRTLSRLKEAEKLFDIGLDQVAKECVIKRDDDTLTIDYTLVRQYEYVLFHLLSPFGFTPSQIENIALYDGERTGKGWESGTHAAVIDRERLVVYRKISNRKPMLIPEEGKYVFTQDETLSFKIDLRGADFSISRHHDIVCVDADVVKFPLTIRYVETADRFMPFGMNGTKLVSDYMTDRKKSLYDKQRQLVVTDAQGNIIWLVDERIDHRYRLTRDTQHVLTMTYSHNKT